MTKKTIEIFSGIFSRIFIGIFIWIFFVCINPLMALKIEITKGSFQPDPIAIVPFSNPDNVGDLGVEISSVIEHDLEGCGLFLPVNHAAFIQANDTLLTTGPRFEDWRLLKARFLVFGEIKSADSGKVTVNFRLFDVNTGKQMEGLSLSGEQNKWRRIAHMAADKIYTRITNESGYFNTQVVFVEAMNAKGKNQKKRLVKMDLDGFNMEPLTDGKDLVLTPRYAPDGKTIAYLKFVKNTANVYVMDLNTKKQTLLGNFDGMNFAPRFSPDGQFLVMSFVKNGSSAIYKMNMTNKQIVQLTEHVSIDTSPCFSHDGKQIAFTSDRSGKEQIYIMDVNGGNVRRITFENGKYSQPVWSPRGDLIAFTKQLAGTFYIGVISPDGGGERLIAQGYLVEGADWSPNGRYIMFSQENINEKGKLRVVDLTGRDLGAIKNNADSSGCSWSPLLK